MRRLRGESGQTAAECLGLLTVVATVIALVAASGLGRVVSAGMSSGLCGVAGGSCSLSAAAESESGGSGWLGAVGDFAGGFAAQGWEMVEGAGETAAWAWRIATSAEQRRENGQIWDAVRDDPVGALGALWHGVTEPIRAEWHHDRQAAAAGRAAAEVASIVVPGKLLAKLKAFRETRALGAAVVAGTAVPTPAEAAILVRRAIPVRSALKSDAYHRSASYVVDDIAWRATVFRIDDERGVRTLVQMPGRVNGVPGRFEWVVTDDGYLTHQTFVAHGTINGRVNAR